VARPVSFILSIYIETLHVHLFTFQLVNCVAGEEFGTSMLALSWDDIFVYVFFVKINIRISFERLLLYDLEFLHEESLAGCLKQI
jgi:hypothetical protein